MKILENWKKFDDWCESGDPLKDIDVDEGDLIEALYALKKENEELQEKADFHDCLIAAGVDNWDGYGYAQEMMNE